MKYGSCRIGAIGCCLLLAGCGSSQAFISESAPVCETEMADSSPEPVSQAGERDAEEVVNQQAVTELVTDEARYVELYDGGEILSDFPEWLEISVSPEEVLRGALIRYDRFEVDGWVFEWFLSDYHDEEHLFLEDSVLAVSREGEPGKVQMLTTEAEGGGGVWAGSSLEYRFQYVDVNFDEVPDLLICTGGHGNQMAETYYCFLQTGDGFKEAPTFTDILNPSIDREKRLILSQWRNSAASHSWAEYEYQGGAFVMARELMEEPLIGVEGQNANEEIWVWTVNGEEIGRSDQMTEEEVIELLYSEKSEWKLRDDRWRTLYSHGMTGDYSIYDEP